MRHLYSFIILLTLALVPAGVCAGNETSYLSSIELRNAEVVRTNREVGLSLLLDLSRLKLSGQHTVALTPVLVSGDGSREASFPPVVLDGKTRNKVYLRAQRLESVDLPPYHDGTAQAVIRRNNGTDQEYSYRATLPYERWMLGGHIELREQVSGCANCAKGSSVQALSAGDALTPFVPHYLVSKLTPEPEPVKRRAESRVARLQFRQGSRVVEPGLQNNRAELDTVTRSIGIVETDPNLTITGIYITGYASPEGTASFNKRLSQDRADALAAYARKGTHVEAAQWHVTGAGEDWEGLRREVEKHPSLQEKQTILELIDACDGDRDACERQLKSRLPAAAYKQLVDEVYSPLRRNEYRIEYNVRGFEMEEAKRQIGSRPELLSLEEICRVADSYGEGSEGYRETMQVAVRTYPDKTVAVVNAARAELERDDVHAAIRLLEGSQAIDAAEVQNALGVAYARSGEYDKARAALQRAKDAGSREASTNLEQLAGVVADL